MLELSGIVLDNIIEITDCNSTSEYSLKVAGRCPLTCLGLLIDLSLYERWKTSRPSAKVPFPTGEDRFTAAVKNMCISQANKTLSSEFYRKVFKAYLWFGRSTSLLDKVGLRRIPRLHAKALRTLDILTTWLPGLEYEDLGGDTDMELFLGRLVQGLRYQEVFRTQGVGHWRVVVIFTYGAMNGELFDVTRCEDIRIV